MADSEDDWVKSRCNFIVSKVEHKGLAPDVPEPFKALFLCMAPRSGSSFFGAVLRDNGFGNLTETFRTAAGVFERDVRTANAKTYEDYIRYKIQKNRHGDWVTTKLDWLQFIPIYYLGAWRKYFSDSYFIYITREDVLMQAVSRYISTESGFFHTSQLAEGETRPKVDVPFDYDKILTHVDHLIRMMASWERFFAMQNVTPLRLTYEKIIEDLPGAVRAAAAYTGRTLKEPLTLENEFEPVSSPLNEHMRAAFVKETRRRGQLAETKFRSPARPVGRLRNNP